MKHIIFFILLFLIIFKGFSQRIAKTEVLGGGRVDTTVTSPILKVTDPTTKRLLDSIVLGEKNGKYYTNSNCYNIIIRRKNNDGLLLIYIDVSDLSYVSCIWRTEYPYYYGSLYYCNRLFMIYGDDASFFFKKTRKAQNLCIKYSPVDESSFLITIEPLMLWYFYYFNGKWYRLGS